MKIKIYRQPNERAIRVCQAMYQGLQSSGVQASIEPMTPESYKGNLADLAIFYGQSGGGKELLKAYVGNGKNVLYVDLGYWKRKSPNDPYSGYHKVSLNGPHPDQQLKFKVDGKRFEQLGIKIRDRVTTDGNCILLAGLSEKAAIVNGYQPYEWERETIKKIREHTSRPIIYRPKPSWRGARPIPGTIFSSNRESIANVLPRTHCVVTRHSNVSIDAMAEGIPAFTELGVAKDVCYSMDQLNEIDTAVCPSLAIRQQLFKQIAYCQWTFGEMASGEMWNWFRGNMYGRDLDTRRSA